MKFCPVFIPAIEGGLLRKYVVTSPRKELYDLPLNPSLNDVLMAATRKIAAIEGIPDHVESYVVVVQAPPADVAPDTPLSSWPPVSWAVQFARRLPNGRWRVRMPKTDSAD